MQAKQKSGKQMRRDATQVRTAAPSPKATNGLKLPRLTRLTAEEYVDATLGNKSGYATYNMATGDVTYRAITWGIKSIVAIAGVTSEIGGVHYVNIEKLPDYLGEVRLVPNGSVLQALDMSELLTRNAFHEQTFGNVFSGFAFPGESMYWDRRFIDAYALGTINFRSLTLELQLKAAFDADTMEVDVMPHAVDIARQTSFTLSNERLNWTFNGAGKHTFWDIPIADDIKDLWIIADGVSHIKMSIGRETLFDMNRAQYEAYLLTNGRNVEALGGRWFLDFHAEGDARSLASLDRPNDMKRNTKIKLELTTTQAETPIEFVVTNAGIYRDIR